MAGLFDDLLDPGVAADAAAPGLFDDLLSSEPKATQADARRAEPVDRVRRRGSLPAVRPEAIGYPAQEPEAPPIRGLRTVLDQPAPASARRDPMLRPEFVEEQRAQWAAVPEAQRLPLLREAAKFSDVNGRAARVILADVEQQNIEARQKEREQPGRSGALSAAARSPTKAGPATGRPRGADVAFPDAQLDITERAEMPTQDQVLARRQAGRDLVGLDTGMKAMADREAVQSRDFEAEDFAKNNPMLGALASGGGQMAAGLLNAVPVVMDFAARLIDADATRAPDAPGVQSMLRTSRSLMPEMGQQDMGKAWDRGEFGGWLALNLTAQAPQIAASVMSAFVPALRGVLLPGMGASAAGTSFAQGDSSLSAVIKGAVEAGSEMLPLKAFDRARKALQALPPGLRGETLGAIGKRLTAVGAVVTAEGVVGAVEEAVAQIGQNGVDRFIEGKNVGLLDQVADAAVLGAFASSAMSVPQGVGALSSRRDMTVEESLIQALETGQTRPAPVIRAQDMPTTPFTPEQVQAMAAARPAPTAPTPGLGASGAPTAAIGASTIKQGALADFADQQLKARFNDQPDVANPAPGPAGGSDERGDLAARSSGTARPVPVEPGPVVPAAAAPVASSQEAGPVGDGSAATADVAPANAPAQQAPAQAEGTETPAPAATAGAVATGADTAAGGSAGVEAGGVDQTATQEGDFIRKATNAERMGSKPRQRAMVELSEQQGRPVVFKPYGSQGPGFYADAPIQPQAQAATQATTPPVVQPPQATAPTAPVVEPAGSTSPVVESKAKPKVYKTRSNAEAAKSGNTQRLKKVQGGYILREATDKEMAAAEKAGQRLRAGAPIDVENDSLLTAISKLGGLAMSERSDTIGTGNRNVAGKMLFRSGGKPIDTLATEALQDYGYIPASYRDDPTNWLRDAIASEYMGTKSHYSEQGVEWMQQGQDPAAELTDEELAEYSAYELEESGYTRATPEVQALTEKLLAEAEELGIDTYAIQEDAAKLTEGQKADDYQRAVQEAARQAIAAAHAITQRSDAGASKGSEQDRGSAAAGQGQAGTSEDLKLEAQDAEGLRAKTEREAAARAAEAKAKTAEQDRLRKEAEARELNDRARQDASADNFELGQDPMDALSGQRPMFSRRMTQDQRQQNLAAWSGGAPIISSKDAETHQFMSGVPIVVEAYHGTARPDRVGTVFQRKRATSGPMAFFTSNPVLASSYAQGKQDTSLANEDQGYSNWFKVKMDGDRSQTDLVRSWYRLDSETKNKIAALAPRVTFSEEQDVDGGNKIVLGDESVTSGTGSYDYNLAQTRTSFDRRGNPLKALIEDWLSSGNLFNDEPRFMQVLKLAGFPMKTVVYDSPTDTFPFVYKTFIKMRKPLVTNEIPGDVILELQGAAKKDRTRAQQSGADMWDKNTRTLREWVRELTQPSGGSAQYVWTSIPDKVTDVLKSMGYDGIVDWSGKGGGNIVSPVYIPFEESQVKSAIGNKGTFSGDKKDILLSRAGSVRNQDPFSSDYTLLAGRKMTLAIKIDGADAKFTVDAAAYMRDIDQRTQALEDLARCLGR